MPNTTGVVSRINIYPVAGVMGISRKEARITLSGSLLGDRDYEAFTLDDTPVTRAMAPQLSKLSFSPTGTGSVTLTGEGFIELTGLPMNGARLASSLSRFLGTVVQVREKYVHLPLPRGVAPRTVLISSETLAAVARGLKMSEEEIRGRVQPTLEIRGGIHAMPFWEETLTATSVSIGSAELLLRGTNVLSADAAIHPTTGERDDSFLQQVAEFRRSQLLTQESATPQLGLIVKFGAEALNLIVHVGDPVSIG